MSYSLKRKHKISCDVLNKTLVKILREIHYHDYLDLTPLPTEPCVAAGTTQSGHP